MIALHPRLDDLDEHSCSHHEVCGDNKVRAGVGLVRCDAYHDFDIDMVRHLVEMDDLGQTRYLVDHHS